MDAKTDAILTEAREWIRTRTGTMESESLIAGLMAEVVRLANVTERQSLTDAERTCLAYAIRKMDAEYAAGPAGVLRELLERFS